MSIILYCYVMVIAGIRSVFQQQRVGELAVFAGEESRRVCGGLLKVGKLNTEMKRSKGKRGAGPLMGFRLELLKRRI